MRVSPLHPYCLLAQASPVGDSLFSTAKKGSKKAVGAGRWAVVLREFDVRGISIVMR